MNSQPARTASLDESAIAIPASAILVARFGGAAALLAAAAISASTLYHLGLLVGLTPQIAWLLPTAFDIYAACAIFTGYRIPPEHPAREAALRSAREALRLTIGCNALDHVLTLTATPIPPAVRDTLLVIVACLPPLIVERLLHLQTLLVSTGATDVPDTALSDRENHEARRLNDPVPAERSPVHAAAQEHVSNQPGRCSDQHQQRPATRHRLELTALAEIGRPVYAGLAERSGRRPGERVFHQALAETVTAITEAGGLPAGSQPPSLSTAKRIRSLIENVHADGQRSDADRGGEAPLDCPGTNEAAA